MIKNKTYNNKYNNNIIKNSVTVYADSIGNTKINREAIWITLGEQYKRSFNSFLFGNGHIFDMWWALDFSTSGECESRYEEEE